MWSLKLKIQFNWRDIPFIFQDLNKIYCSGQCLGSIKFWCGSGSGSWIGTGKKMDPDPSHFSNFLFYFFSLIFILKLDEPFRNQKIFIISLFKSSDLGFRSKKVLFCIFWLIVYPLDPDSWISKAKILRIQRNRIRILSTGSGKGGGDERSIFCRLRRRS